MRIEQVVPAEPRDLWWGLIENALATGHGVVLRLALPGGHFHVAGDVTRYESPTLLECDSNGTLLRFEFRPHGDGMTHVVFTHGPQSEDWQACLANIIDRATSKHARTAKARP